MNISQFIEAYKDMLQNYVNFKGRVSRQQFWYATAVNFVISVILSIVSSILASIVSIFGLIPSIYSLAVLLPSCAYGFRRVQDVGKNGLLFLIPLYNLYLFIQPSKDEENQDSDNSKSIIE